MKLSWDEAKRQATIDARGLDFAATTASAVTLRPAISEIDWWSWCGRRALPPGM